MSKWFELSKQVLMGMQGKKTVERSLFSLIALGQLTVDCPHPPNPKPTHPWHKQENTYKQYSQTLWIINLLKSETMPYFYLLISNTF